MRLLKAIIAVIAISLGSPAAYAQCTGQPAPGGTCGNPGAAAALPSWATMTSLLDRNFGGPSTQGTVLNRGASSWAATATPVVGLNGGTGGSLTLNGATSGSALISVQAAAGTSTLFQLPNSNGTNAFVLTTDGSGHLSWTNPAAGGTVTSVGLSLPGIFTVSGSPVTIAGTLTGTLATQSANTVWAGPNTGAASAPTFRALVGADLPNPSASTLGGVESFAAVGSQWIRQISTSGVPTASQPAFGDISGVASASQIPNPTASTLGGIESLAAVSSKWINTISTSGVPSATQPVFSDIGGSAILAQLPSMSNNTLLSNISGGSSVPSANTLTSVIDTIIGSTQGQVLYRSGTVWTALNPGTAGQVLTTGGPAANPSWGAVAGTGTVTNVATNNGVTGGPITTTGTIGLASISTGNVLANTSGISAAPSATTPTSVLDVIGSTQGSILYRGASVWTALTPGTSGQYLQTQGAGSTPQWASAVNSLNGQSNSALVMWPFPQGRITLTSNTPVLSASVAGGTTVYYTGYTGKNVPIYNGSAVAVYQLCAANTVGACELSIVLGANWTTVSNYDLFLALDGATLRLCTGPAWSTSLSRGSGAGTTQLAVLDGLQTNAVTLTCRYNNTTTFSVAANQGTYVGSMLTGSAGQTNYIFGASASGGTAGLFGIWNAYNRVTVASTVTDSGSFYTYTSATIRQARASAGNQIQFIIGLTSDGITASYDAETATIASGASTTIGLGFDSTTVISCQSGGLHSPTGSTGVRATTVAICSWNPAIGTHILSANENSDSSNANQYDNSGSNSLNISMSN